MRSVLVLAILSGSILATSLMASDEPQEMTSKPSVPASRPLLNVERMKQKQESKNAAAVKKAEPEQAVTIEEAAQELGLQPKSEAEQADAQRALDKAMRKVQELRPDDSGMRAAKLAANNAWMLNEAAKGNIVTADRWPYQEVRPKAVEKPKTINEAAKELGLTPKSKAEQEDAQRTLDKAKRELQSLGPNDSGLRRAKIAVNNAWMNNEFAKGNIVTPDKWPYQDVRK
jgi:phage terminase small subunit